MLTISKVSSVEYYIQAATQAERDQLTYYLDQDAGEAAGEWYVRGRASGHTEALGISSGEEITDKSIRSLAAGRHAKNGDQLVQLTNKKRNAGSDLTFSAPKTVSALRALALVTGREGVAAIIDRAHDEAVKAAIDMIYDGGYVEARRGKNGVGKEAAQEIAVALYKHQTSREGDPQLHSHAVLMNVCVRVDGTTGAIDNTAIMDRKKLIGAVYRSALARNLIAEGVGIEREKDAFRIIGMPDGLVKDWSKRAKKITDQIEKEYGDNATAKQKKLATLKTRQSKDLVAPIDELKVTWKREAEAHGDLKEIWSQLAIQSEKSVTEYKSMNHLDVDAIREARVKREIADFLDGESVITLRTAKERALVGMAEFADVQAADEIVNRLVAQRDLILIGAEKKTLDQIYTNQSTLLKERDLIAGSFVRQGEDRSHLVEKLDTGHMSDEQVAAVRHVMSGASVTVVEGAAGSGKSVSMSPVAELYRRQGKQVFAVAPTAKAAGGLAEEISGEGNTLAKMLLSKFDGVNEGDALILDEAGMVGTSDLHAFLKQAHEKKANVILTGDRNQLQSISAGSALRLVAEVEGVAQISTIRRQREEWQQAASQEFFKGKAKAGLSAYFDNGKVKWAHGKASTIEMLAEDWRQFSQENPEKTSLVIANKNGDVAELNQSLRQKSREMGRLGDDEFRFDAIQQHGEEASPLAISQGDRLLFRKNIRVGGQKIANSDFATITGISGKGENLHLSIRTDRGVEVSAPLGDFRDQEGALNMRHGYAATNYSAQGATVDQTFGLYQQGMKAESMYVMATRHRQDFQLYVDREEIQKAAQAMEGFELAVGGGRAEVGHENVNDVEFDQAHLEAMVLNSVDHRDTKKNAVDFISHEELLEGRINEERAHEIIDIQNERAARKPVHESQVDEAIAARKAKVDAIQKDFQQKIDQKENILTTELPAAPTGLKDLKGRPGRIFEWNQSIDQQLGKPQTEALNQHDHAMEAASHAPAYQPPWALSEVQVQQVRAFQAQKAAQQQMETVTPPRELSPDEKAKLDAWRKEQAPAEQKPVEAKPEVQKPVETKPEIKAEQAPQQQAARDRLSALRKSSEQQEVKKVEKVEDQPSPAKTPTKKEMTPDERSAAVSKNQDDNGKAVAAAKQANDQEVARARLAAAAEEGRFRAAREAAVGKAIDDDEKKRGPGFSM